MVLVASQPISAGFEVRFDYERGARKGTYWGAIGGRPVEGGSWRRTPSLPPPPPTCAEPLINYLPSLRQGTMMDVQRPGEHAATTYSTVGGGGGPSAAAAAAVGARLCPPSPRNPHALLPTAEADADVEWGFEGGETCRAESLAALDPPPPSSPVPWEGHRGGEAVLAAVIALIQPS